MIEKLQQLGFTFSDDRFHCYTAFTHLHKLISAITDKTVLCVSNRNIEIDASFMLNTLTVKLAKKIVQEGNATTTVVAFFVDTIENLDMDELITASFLLITNGAHVYVSAGDNVVPTSSEDGEYQYRSRTMLQCQT